MLSYGLITIARLRLAKDGIDAFVAFIRAKLTISANMDVKLNNTRGYNKG